MNQIKGATLVHAPRLRLSRPSIAHEGPGFCGRKRAFWYFRQDARLVCSLQCRLLLTLDFLTLEYLPPGEAESDSGRRRRLGDFPSGKSRDPIH